MTNRIGVIIPLENKPGLFAAGKVVWGQLGRVKRLESQFIHPGAGETISKEAERPGITITSLWAGWPGPAVWDFINGPTTLGIVPKQYRPERISALKRARILLICSVCLRLSLTWALSPKLLSDPAFQEVVDAVKEVAVYLADLGMEFWFETGQETPVTMLRLIDAVGTGNMGVNLDPANLILYGKANPVDALDVFGSFVRSVHAKDGFYPITPYQLGEEVKIGMGKVNFPLFFARLDEIGYTGPFIIEREISGSQQIRDIQDSITFLSSLLSQ